MLCSLDHSMSRSPSPDVNRSHAADAPTGFLQGDEIRPSVFRSEFWQEIPL
jgi:hypothetical protein